MSLIGKKYNEQLKSRMREWTIMSDPEKTPYADAEYFVEIQAVFLHRKPLNRSILIMDLPDQLSAEAYDLVATSHEVQP